MRCGSGWRTSVAGRPLRQRRHTEQGAVRGEEDDIDGEAGERPVTPMPAQSILVRPWITARNGIAEVVIATAPQPAPSDSRRRWSICAIPPSANSTRPPNKVRLAMSPLAIMCAMPQSATPHRNGWRVIVAMPRTGCGSSSSFSPPTPVAMRVVTPTTTNSDAKGITMMGIKRNGSLSRQSST